MVFKYKFLLITIFFLAIVAFPPKIFAESCCPAGKTWNVGRKSCCTRWGCDTYFTCSAGLICDGATGECSSNPVAPIAPAPTITAGHGEDESCCSLGWIAWNSGKFCCESITNSCNMNIVCDSNLYCDKPTGRCTSNPIDPVPLSPSPFPTSAPFDPCKNINQGAAPAYTSLYYKCSSCVQANGTWTGLWCIPNDPPALVGWIVGWGAGIAGGIAFLLFLGGAGQIVLSSGNPEKLQKGKEVITSAITGLVFIFLSVMILKLIGVQILGIPGWR